MRAQMTLDRACSGVAARPNLARTAARGATCGRRSSRAVRSRAAREGDRHTEEKGEQNPRLSVERRHFLAGAAGLGMLASPGEGHALSLPRFGKPSAPPLGPNAISPEWEVVDLPVDDDVVLLDIAFVPDEPGHGFLLGTRQSLLETLDGGKTWRKRTLDAAQDEGFNYRFNSISFSGKEGWIVGKPAILLHTTNGGQSWERVPLNAKLPGAPVLITALAGDGNAEMTTDVGAIYVTSNGGMLWTAAVQETVDATLNRTLSSGISGASYYTGQFSSVKRSAEGKYVAVSSRGNFYMTWEPGQTYWQPHNRTSARRLQDMGWRPEGGLWLATRGGDLYFNTNEADLEDFKQVNFGSRGFGILDVGYQPNGTLWAAGGSGTLYKSSNRGNSWSRIKGGDKVPGNFYAVKFMSEKQGYILGNAGILLRYIG